MDVLSPELMWMEGRCFRINAINEVDENDDDDDDDDDVDNPSNRQSKIGGYVEEDLYEDEDGDEEDDYVIEVVDKNRFKTSFHVPHVFYALIIGSKGITKKRIETETQTQIKVPKQGDTTSHLEILGTIRQNVATARRRIEIMILAARAKQQNTHFLCVPFTNMDIKTNYLKFKNQILSDQNIFGLNESLFQNIDKLHLTIGLLCLMDNEDRAQASLLLQDCEDMIIKPIIEKYGEICIQMNGIEYMNDDPSEVDVLYGKVESEPLQLIADKIIDYFVVKGLMQPQFHSVKLHVTLMNSSFREKYRENEPQQLSESHHEHQSKKQKRETFDAREILKKYLDYKFGEQLLSEIHLSLRFSTATNGFYEATAIVKV